MKNIQDEISTLASKMDCLIIIGSAFNNGTHQSVQKLFNEALSRKLQIIEINPKPLLNYMGIYKLCGDHDDVVPRLCKVI